MANRVQELPGSSWGKRERPQAMPRVRGFILLSVVHGALTTVANSDTTCTRGCSSLDGREFRTVSISCSWMEKERERE